MAFAVVGRMVYSVATLLLAFRAGAMRSLARTAIDTDDRGPSTTAEYPVHLLVTRHGLSCANIVQKWISKFDFGRGSILDPPLGGVGQFGSRQAGDEVKQWLLSHNLTVDALLSSNLGRAIETGLLMYPESAKPLYVVPYIREHASGSSNSPAPRTDQVRNVKEAILPGQPYQLNYHWVEIFGGEAGTWADFVRFLRTSFLPSLIENLGKPANTPIVLAVVTHSLFMKESDVGAKCKDLWTQRGASKPLNNQVVDMAYTFSITSPSSESTDGTPIYALDHASPCVEVAGEKPMENMASRHEGPVCLSDVGHSCIDPILENSLWPKTLMEKTYEDAIVKIAVKIAETEEELKEEQRKLAGKTAYLETLKKLESQHGGLFTCMQAGSFGCTPKTYCQSTWSGCELLPEYNVRYQESEYISLQNSVHGLQRNIKHLKNKLVDDRSHACWAGGHPDVGQLPSLPEIQSHPQRERIFELALN